MLTSEQTAAYDRDGFLVVRDFVSSADCARLRDRANEMVASWEPSAERSVFTTNEQERSSNREFLDSGATTWCFFEEEAFDSAGELTQPKELSINKIGHAQHDLDDEFGRFAYNPRLAEVADRLGLVDPRALQSMYIFKQPHIGGEVSCHQDATFLYTDPITVTGFWFAIEDATLDNGCLWAAPGGHRGPLRQLFKRNNLDDPSAADGTTFEPLDTTPLPHPPADVNAAHDTTMVPLEVPVGTLVVLHGLLPHWSGINRSPTSRHAYSLHCISGAAAYPTWNWLQRPADMPLRGLRDAPDTSSGSHR
jgi:phytanoyl-CoA hydroxylase